MLIVRVIGINLVWLVLACLLDIVAAALVPRFDSFGLTLTWLAVAGVFSGVFCLSVGFDSVDNEYKPKASLHTVLLVVALCLLLFVIVAPASGVAYNWPLRAFAITQTMVVIFLHREKFYQER